MHCRLFPPLGAALVAAVLVLPSTGCHLARGGYPGAGISATTPPLASARAARGARRSRQVTSVFLWGPIPPTLPLGSVAISSLTDRVLGAPSIFPGAMRRPLPGVFSPGAHPGQTRGVLWTAGQGPVVQMTGLAGAISGIWMGSDPASWHATPWLSGAMQKAEVLENLSWVSIELSLLALYPYRGIPVAYW